MPWIAQVSETVMQGLQITIIGMLLVFFTLGLVIVSLILLTRLPGLRVKEQPEEEPQETHAEPVPAITPALPESRDSELELVAAIAVGLLRSQRAALPRPKPRAASSSWKGYGRAQGLGL